MPLRIGVTDLQLLSLKVLSSVMKKLCNEKSISLYDLAAVVSHFKIVPPPIQSEICKTFIEEFKKNNNGKVPLNEKHLFFCAYLNSEEIFMNEFERTLLFLNDLRGAHFKKLTFIGASFPFPETDIDQELRFRIYQPLYTFMSSLRNLTTFHAVRMCDDYMFQLFSEYCPNMEEIEVELCYTVGDEGVSYLCGYDTLSEVEADLRSGSCRERRKGCKNLKKIILDFTMASYISVAALLQFCPKLEIVNVSPDVNIGEVFSKIHSGYDLEMLDYESLTRKYNIISLRSYLELEESMLSLIAETCPRLQEVSIRCYGSERKDKNLLANLLVLPVNSVDVVNCNTESLLWFLSLKGSEIIKLVIEHLITAPQTVFLNRSHLQYIISACPNLTHFSLKMCGNVSISPNIPYSSFGNNLKYFTTLKDLYIEGVNLEPEDLKVLISQSKNIEDISLMCQSLEILEDALLYDLLSMGTLKKLKNFYAFRPFLTYAGLQRLLNECPDLEKVGPLSSWAIPKKERERLFYDIKKNNWQLNIESPETL